MKKYIFLCASIDLVISYVRVRLRSGPEEEVVTSHRFGHIKSGKSVLVDLISKSRGKFLFLNTQIVGEGENENSGF
jgi:hypothetical protein